MSLKNLEKLDKKEILQTEVQVSKDNFSEAGSSCERSDRDNLSDSDITDFQSETTLKTESSAKQSIISFLTIKSRAFGQLSNEHWKERASERGNLDLDDDDLKSEILRELKAIMQKNPENIQPSKKNPERFLVTGKDGLHYVLQKRR